MPSVQPAGSDTATCTSAAPASVAVKLAVTVTPVAPSRSAVPLTTSDVPLGAGTVAVLASVRSTLPRTK